MILIASKSLYVALITAIYLRRKRISIIENNSGDVITIYIDGISRYVKYPILLDSIDDHIDYRTEVITEYNDGNSDTKIVLTNDSHDHYTLKCNGIFSDEGFSRTIQPLHLIVHEHTAHRLARFISICKHCYTSDMKLYMFGRIHM